MAFGTNGTPMNENKTQKSMLGPINELDQSSTNALLKLRTRDHLFQINKFVEVNDLCFSNDPTSICRQLATKLNIQELQVEQWWAEQKKQVLKSFHIHRNNVIKSIGQNFQGM